MIHRPHLAALTLAGALMLSACSDTGNGATVQSLRAAAGVQSTSPAATATPAPLPTETPDIAPQTFIQPAPPAQMIEVPVEVTRIVPATVEVEVTREVVQVQQVEVTATPQPVPTCDPRTPAPTIALDESDRAAGVVLRGQWPCYNGAQFVMVQP